MAVNRKSNMGDYFLISVVVLMSVGANLPDSLDITIDRKFLLIGLIGIVAVSLIRYLNFTFILAISILAVGANLPVKFANELGIDQSIMLFALVAMLIISLTNYIFKLPTGIESSKQTSGNRVHGATALYSAISKGRLPTVRAILNQGVSPNVRTNDGQTPLIYAASKGYGDIIQLLLANGADVRAVDQQHRNALDIAAENGFTRVAELLRGSGATASSTMSDSTEDMAQQG